MRHFALGVVLASALALLTSASAAVEVSRPTLLFASVHDARPGQPVTAETVADIFVLKGTAVTRRLTNTPLWEQQPDWSPDQRRIAFGRGEPLCHSNWCVNRPIGMSVWVQRVGGGAARRITHAGVDYVDSSPAWSPDGRLIAFARSYCCDDDPKDGIYTISPNGRNQVRLATVRAVALDWSPDGSQLAYVTENGGIRVLDIETAEITRLKITNIGADKGDIAWSPNGQALAVASRAGIFVVKSTGGRARRVAKVGAALWQFGGVAWSPDGRRLAFSGTMGTDPDALADVYVVGANGRGLTALTTNPGPDFDPQWKP